MAAICSVFTPGFKIAGSWVYDPAGSVHPPMAVPIGTPLRMIVALESTMTLIITGTGKPPVIVNRFVNTTS